MATIPSYEGLGPIAHTHNATTYLPHGCLLLGGAITSHQKWGSSSAHITFPHPSLDLDGLAHLWSDPFSRRYSQPSAARTTALSRGTPAGLARTVLRTWWSVVGVLHEGLPGPKPIRDRNLDPSGHPSPLCSWSRKHVAAPAQT